MPVMGVSRFERFFRVSAGLDVDGNDLERYDDFVSRELRDLLVVAEAAASANRRDVIQPSDLPITKGLQRCMHEFRSVDEEVELRPLLERLATLPPLDRALSVETEERLPAIVGGLSLALARAFRVMDPELRNPSSVDWERAFRLFDLLL
jgi:hypothetical protein